MLAGKGTTTTPALDARDLGLGALSGGSLVTVATRDDGPKLRTPPSRRELGGVTSRVSTDASSRADLRGPVTLASFRIPTE
jgi:hypothetical protein